MVFTMDDFRPYMQTVPDESTFEGTTEDMRKRSFVKMYLEDIKAGNPISLPAEHTVTIGETYDELHALDLTITESVAGAPLPKPIKVKVKIKNVRNPKYKATIVPSYEPDKLAEWKKNKAQEVFNFAFSEQRLGKNVSPLGNLVFEAGITKETDPTLKPDRGVYFPEVAAEIEESIKRGREAEKTMPKSKQERLLSKFPPKDLERVREKMRRELSEGEPPIQASYSSRLLEASLNAFLLKYAQSAEASDIWVDSQGRTFNTQQELVAANAPVWNMIDILESFPQAIEMLEGWLAAAAPEATAPSEPVLPAEKPLPKKEEPKKLELMTPTKVAPTEEVLEEEEVLAPAAQLLTKLVKLAAHLDSKQQYEVADRVDQIIKKLTTH